MSFHTWQPCTGACFVIKNGIILLVTRGTVAASVA